MSACRLACGGRWPLALAALAVSNWLAAAPADVLDDCAAGPPHVGIRELAAACPQVEPSLQSLGLDRLLVDGWRERLSSRDLDDLSILVRRYSDSQRHASPNVAPLAPILQSLRQQQIPISNSWWDAARAWLRDWLRHSDSALAKWLNEWLEHLDMSEHALDWAIYSLMALIVIAAVVVVVREVRLSTRARRAGSRSAAALGHESQAVGPSGGTKQLTGVRELLQSLVERLLATGRLASAGGLTHRELVVRSQFDSEKQRSVFAGVAGEAESALYGPERSAEELPDIAIDGHALLAQLSDRKEAP